MNALRTKVALGYALIALLMGAILFIWLGEWRDVEQQEKEYRQINHLREEVHNIHMQMIDLSLLGETVLEWDSIDVELYHAKRLTIDTLLVYFKDIYPAERIDSVRLLLEDKEKHLVRIMNLIDRQEDVNEQIAEQVPVIAATSEQEPAKKRNGFFGLFTKKTEEQPTASSMLYTLNDQMIAKQRLQQSQLAEYADSLAQRNTQLNIQLQELIGRIDSKVREDLQKRESSLYDMHNRSYNLVGTLTFIMGILLIVLYVIMHRNLKWRDEIQHQLEESVKRNNRLLEMREKTILTISHDIRGPLNVINGSAELALDARNKNKRNNYLKNIPVHCKHILNLLNNLLDIYRLNDGKEYVNNVPFRLSSMTDRIVAGIAPAIHNKGLLFNPHFENTDIVVKGDMDRIEQIIDNLLTNAVKFTHAGHIGFEVSHSDGNLRIVVQDTGVGMDKDMIAKISLPFERGSDCAKIEGFGLGMPITYGLVNLLEGRIAVESEPGKGSTFRVTLPLPLTDESVEEETILLDETLLLPRRVLVIDDSPTQLTIVKEMLERSGVSCTVCNNVADLVKEMRKREYDMLLSDIQMPDMDGFALLQLLRKSQMQSMKEIPVIAVTAKGGEHEKEYFIGRGFCGCIFKPFSTVEFLQSISNVMLELEEQKATDFYPLISEVSDKALALENLVKECRTDISELDEASKTDDRIKMRAVVHRMLPIWELMLQGELLREYQRILKDDYSDMAVIRTYTENVMKKLNIWIADAGKEIERRRQ